MVIGAAAHLARTRAHARGRRRYPPNLFEHPDPDPTRTPRPPGFFLTSGFRRRVLRYGSERTRFHLDPGRTQPNPGVTHFFE